MGLMSWFARVVRSRSAYMLLITADKMAKIKTQDVDGLLRVYGALYYDALGRAPDPNTVPKVRRIFNYILERYTINQLYAMVFCHFEWYGESGTTISSFQHLRENGFPIEWLTKQADKYSAYISKTLTSEVWWNEAKLKNVIDFWTKRLFTVKDDMVYGLPL